MTFKVAGIDYEIVQLSPEHMHGHIGQADFNAQQVRLSNSYSIQTKKIAVYHEIIHILSDAWGLHLTEDQVKIGTHALIAFIADNPDFDIKKILETLS